MRVRVPSVWEVYCVVYFVFWGLRGRKCMCFCSCDLFLNRCGTCAVHAWQLASFFWGGSSKVVVRSNLKGQLRECLKEGMSCVVGRVSSIPNYYLFFFHAEVFFCQTGAVLQ